MPVSFSPRATARPVVRATTRTLALAVPLTLAAGLFAGTSATTSAADGASDARAATSAATTADVSLVSNRLTAGKPTRATTGVPRGLKLRKHRGDLVIRKAGTVIDRMDVRGFVIVKAPNVTIKRSIVRGGRATGNIGLITNYGSRNLVVKDTTLKPRRKSVWVDGLKGWNFRAYRVHIIGGVDSVKVHGDNVLIKKSLLERTTYFRSDPNQGGGPTHNDNVQVLNGRNIRIVKNTIRGATNMAVYAAPEKGAARVEVAGNWLDGGHCTVKLASKGGHGMVAQVSENKFGPNRKVRSCVLLATPGISFAQSRNVWESTGRTVPILRKAD